MNEPATTFGFVDGLNLYHGMKDANLLKFRWLDIHRLCEHLSADATARIGQTFQLDRTVYCTSFVTNTQAQRRQDIYLQALQAHRPGLRVRHGKYEVKSQTHHCQCGRVAEVGFPKEKRTDVNLAVEMLRLAAAPETRPGAVLLVTGDTDLVPAIEALQEEYGMTVIVAAPPARHQEHLNAVADCYLRVGRRQLKYSPLPAVVVRPDNGYELTPPGTWVQPDHW